MHRIYSIFHANLLSAFCIRLLTTHDLEVTTGYGVVPESVKYHIKIVGITAEIVEAGFWQKHTRILKRQNVKRPVAIYYCGLSILRRLE